MTSKTERGRSVWEDTSKAPLLLPNLIEPTAED